MNTAIATSDVLNRVASWLNRARLSAAPCPWLGAISIFVDERYENYDYDLIGPRTRLAIARALGRHDYSQRTGRELVGPLGRIEFPRPNRTLSSDPAAELEAVLDRRNAIAFATPTQILLATWRREGPNLSDERQDDLVALVREQPANLDKITDWLRRTDHADAFARLKPRLAEVQEEGFQLRRAGRFRSRLPR